MHKRRSYFALLFVSLFGAGLTAIAPAVGWVLMAASLLGLACVIWPNQARKIIVHRTPNLLPYVTRAVDFLMPQPRLVLICRGIEQQAADVYQIRCVIKNEDGGATAKNLRVTFELPPDIRGNDVGHGWMEERIQDTFEPNGRVAVAVGMYNELEGLTPGAYTQEFFGLFIPAKAYPNGSKISLKYRMDAEDMEPIYGQLEAKMKLDG